MGPGDIAQWEEEYTPVFDREGLIVDVRHNRGGNIDSWVLNSLLRKPWMYWQARGGLPYWNMQGAFRGPVVVLCDELTASDGEAFAEGFRRLGLGKLIGVRTWGGEVWLSSSNELADRGIATAAEMGVYGPRAKVADRGPWSRPGHDSRQSSACHVRGARRTTRCRNPLLEPTDLREAQSSASASPYPDKSFKASNSKGMN